MSLVADRRPLDEVRARLRKGWRLHVPKDEGTPYLRTGLQQDGRHIRVPREDVETLLEEGFIEIDPGAYSSGTVVHRIVARELARGRR